uniref:Membrane protein, palmitoylated 4a (MAGUK p55 subfamily member 4) n=1 Tax=Sphaeramia orbicularis TaxID=375764 RepID=A0A672YFC9_9TELE
MRRNEETGEIYIARVIHGGLADRSGLLHPGDQLVEVNGSPVVGLEPEQVIKILINSQGTILFKIIPDTKLQVSLDSVHVLLHVLLSVRCLCGPWWTTAPFRTPPSPALTPGVAFSRADLLEVVDQSDGYWWQARKLPCTTSCAGLIPSASTLKRRTSFRRRRQSCTTCTPSGSGLSTPYEEVTLYQRPPQENHRLIILVGASGVGVNELRKRLIKMNPSTFQGPVPHTTRPIRPEEQTGREYHFVSKELFEYMVCNHRFVEYGESKGHLYGTSSDAIDDVLKRGRMCIVDVEPHSILSLRTRKLKPYVIFIKAPSSERLRETRKNARIITNYTINRAFTEDDFSEVEDSSQLIEAKYKQFFDCTLVNDDLQDACMQLCSIIQQAQDEPQWIPVSWTRTED